VKLIILIEIRGYLPLAAAALSIVAVLLVMSYEECFQSRAKITWLKSWDKMVSTMVAIHATLKIYPARYSPADLGFVQASTINHWI
jgi:hypothetical protein